MRKYWNEGNDFYRIVALLCDDVKALMSLVPPLKGAVGLYSLKCVSVSVSLSLFFFFFCNNCIVPLGFVL